MQASLLMRSTQELLDSARVRLAAADVDAPVLTCLLLLEHVAGFSREQLLAHPEQLMTAEGAAAFEQAIERRCDREPLAYILGWREFFGRRFVVNSSVLIPRPETEGVVERALHWLKHHHIPTTKALSALDVGTGSGAIVVSLLAEVPSLLAVATDASLGALRVARENARAHGVQDRLQLVACDLTAGLHGTFPLILANLPYVSNAEIASLQPEIGFEPLEALDGGPDGTIVIQGLLTQLPSLLAPGGLAILEIGHDQGSPLVTRCAAELPGWTALVEPDAAGCDRYLLLERPLG